MGKQDNTPQIVSQEEFDKNLNDSMNILIEDGADDETINTYIKDYKSRFQVGEVKKKDFSVDSENQRTDGSLESNTGLSELEVAQQLFSSSPVEEKDERTKELLADYNSKIQLSEEELTDIDTQIKEEKSGNFGFLDNIKKVYSNFSIMNPLLPSTVYTDPNQKQRNELRKAISEERKIDIKDVDPQEVNDIIFKEREAQLIQSRKDSKTEEFIEELNEDDKLKMQKHFNIEFSNKFKKSVVNSLEREEITDRANEIEKIIDERKATFDSSQNYPEEYYQENRKLAEEYVQLAIQNDKKTNEFNDINNEISSTSNEIDLFKRNYGKTENFLNRVSASTLDLGLNIAYLLNKANRFNPQYAISSMALEDAIVKEKASIDKWRGTFRRSKSVDNISSWEDGAEWALDLIAEQTPNTILMASTGGTASLYVMGASSAGAKLAQLEDEERKGLADYSELQKYSSAFLTGGVEALSERISLGQVKKGLRVFKSVPVPELKRTTANYFKKSFTRTGALEHLKDVTEEGTSEFVSQFSENFTDRYLLGKDVSLTNGLKESFISGAFMSNLYKAPALMKTLSKPFISKDANQKIGENNSKILKYSELLQTGLNDAESSRINSKRDELLAENDNILNKTFGNLDKLSDNQKKRLLEIENTIFDFRKEFQSINDSNYDADTKRDLLKDIEKDVEVLEGEREGILKFESTLSKETNEFVDAFDNVLDISDIDNGTAQIDINGAKASVKSENGVINLKSISVDKKDRGQGKAKEALKKITEIADEKGVDIQLTVQPLDDTTNKEQLEKFYSDNGFTKTEGDVMVRKPKKESSLDNIDTIIESTETEFNPLESEGESIARLAEQVSENKTVEDVAKEHTDSYLEYLNEQGAGDNVLNSNFVKTFESRLVKALNNPSNFNANQDRTFKNGSRINSEGKVISEQQYLSEKGEIEVQQAQTENTQTDTNNTETTTVETNSNNYSIELNNGELEIKPELGGDNVTISQSERRNVIRAYEDSFDFSKGNEVDFSGRDSATDNEISKIVAEESNNPLEVLREYNKQKENTVEVEKTKDDYIADTLRRFALTNESKREVTDLGSVYTNTGLKSSKERKSIDQIREIAESDSGLEVSYQDVLDFLNQYPKISDFRESKGSSLQSELKDRFKEITGLELNNRLVNKLNERYNEKQPTEEDSNDVPFQTESNQTRVSGAELASLVDRLLKTGLANDVKIMSDSEIDAFLEKEGISKEVKKQIIGQGALLSDTIMTHLELAKELDKVNETPKGIKRLTGWEKGFDGKWRYKTPNDFTIKGDIPFGKTVKLEDLNPKSELFEAYPFLKFTEVTITRPKKIGFFKILIKRITGSPIYTTLGNARIKRFLTTWQESVEQGVRSPVGEINVFLENKKEIESTLNHEIQHIIQTAEGFAQGGNSQLFDKPTDIENFRLYQRIAGEVEARNVQTRMKLSPEERKKKLLSETEDISREDQFDIQKYLDGEIKLQQEMSKNGISSTPNGFVYKGVVYLNRDKVKRDTPIHEFGHLWNSYIKENNREVYDRGLELIEGTEYHNQVLNNPAYSHLSKEGKLEEALAQAIGEKGVKILNESKKRNFSKWFKDLFKAIGRGLGLRNMSPEKLSNITLDKFTDLASAELLSGQNITNKNTDTNDSNTSGIDSIVNSEKARIEERNKLIDEIKSKKAISEDVRKKLIKYINDKLNSKNVDEVNKREIKSLLNSVKNSKTKRNLLNAFNKVDDIFLKIENKILIKDIKKILNRKLSKKESGRRKANLVTEEVESILDFIKENVFSVSDVEAPVPFKNNKSNKLSERLAELIQQREDIKNRKEIFALKRDKIDVESLSIAIDILSGLTSNDSKTTNERLTGAFNQISEIYNNGRSELIALRESTRDSLDNSINEYIEDADLSGERTTKSNQELDKENKSLLKSFGRTLFTIGSGKLSGNLDSIMTIISKKGGNNRDSSPLVRFVNKIKNRETFKKRRIALFSNIVSQNQKSIFGSIRNADVILNRKQTVTVRKKPFESDPNTPKNEETREYTNSELLNLWMNYKNEKLRAGLENNGFDQKFFEDLKLPNSVIEYGETLFDVYEQLHKETDEVYRKMNFHSMGKEDFYAGKVYREDVDNKKEDLKLEGGSFSVNTTGFGSQKERTSNDKPIQAVDVNMLVRRAISETSHYTAYAEVHREMTRLLDNKEFGQVVRLNNGNNGDLIMDMLRFYKERDLEKGGYKGNAILDLFGRNITRATLALKAKVGITQTISFLNGATDMPTKPVKPFITYYNPVEIVKTMRFLLKDSEYLQNRYDVDGIENAVTGLSDLANKSPFSLENNTLEANRKAFARFMNQAINISLSNVKYGDMFGLSGAVPAYMAWRDKFESEGLSKEKAHEKALRKFEASADRSQQTTSSFGKSPFQRDPIGRYLAMFATSPIQNMQNANYHWRELMRGLSKDRQAKGTNFQNIMGILNYQFAQPMLYTYIANLLAGSILPVIGFGEEEPDDVDKSLANSFIMSNYGSIPAIGGIFQLFLDKATGKEFSFGSLINSPMISFIDDLNEDLEKWMNAKNKQAQVKYRTRTLKKLSALLVSVPNILTDTALDFEEIYWNDDVDGTVKLLKALGWSNFTIEKARTKRTSRIKAKREKVKEQRKWNKSLKKYERQKKIIKTKKQFKEGQDKR